MYTCYKHGSLVIDVGTESNVNQCIKVIEQLVFKLK
jgi:hypothetical protein